MSPHEFETLKAKKGWEYLAHRRWQLNPSEASILAHLVFSPGRIFTLEELGQTDNWHANATGSPGAVRKRVERLREKLADVGFIQSVETVTGIGYAIPAWLARRIDGGLKYACGVEIAA